MLYNYFTTAILQIISLLYRARALGWCGLLLYNGLNRGVIIDPNELVNDYIIYLFLCADFFTDFLLLNNLDFVKEFDSFTACLRVLGFVFFFISPIFLLYLHELFEWDSFYSRILNLIITRRTRNIIMFAAAILFAVAFITSNFGHAIIIYNNKCKNIYIEKNCIQLYSFSEGCFCCKVQQSHSQPKYYFKYKLHLI